jgi:hypothetical protein
LSLQSINEEIFTNRTGLNTSTLLDLTMVYACNLAWPSDQTPQHASTPHQLKAIVAAYPHFTMRVKLAVKANPQFRQSGEGQP